MASARRGDSAAFERLVAGYRGELYAHCYRMLGSVEDARGGSRSRCSAPGGAWPGSRVAAPCARGCIASTTNACLRLIARRPGRMLSVDHGPPRRDTHDLGEPMAGPVWLEPLPDEVPARANGQLAFACYQGDPDGDRFRLGAINVLSLRAGRIVEIAGFLDPDVHRHCGIA